MTRTVLAPQRIMRHLFQSLRLRGSLHRNRLRGGPGRAARGPQFVELAVVLEGIQALPKAGMTEDAELTVACQPDQRFLFQDAALLGVQIIEEGAPEEAAPADGPTAAELAEARELAADILGLPLPERERAKPEAGGA